MHCDQLCVILTDAVSALAPPVLASIASEPIASDKSSSANTSGLSAVDRR